MDRSCSCRSGLVQTVTVLVKLLIEGMHEMAKKALRYCKGTGTVNRGHESASECHEVQVVEDIVVSYLMNGWMRVCKNLKIMKEKSGKKLFR